MFSPSHYALGVGGGGLKTFGKDCSGVANDFTWMRVAAWCWAIMLFCTADSGFISYEAYPLTSDARELLMANREKEKTNSSKTKTKNGKNSNKLILKQTNTCWFTTTKMTGLDMIFYLLFHSD